MLYVIETGGKQYLVKPGSTLKIEKLVVEVDKEVVFDKVLMSADENSGEVKLGNPYLAGVSLPATVLEQGKGEKVRVVKFKRKVRYTRTRGHRQLFTKVKVK